MSLCAIASLCLLLSSAVLNMVMTASASDVGSVLYALEAKERDLRKANDEREIALSSTLSVRAIQEEALANGYIPRTNVVSLAEPMTLAKQ